MAVDLGRRYADQPNSVTTAVQSALNPNPFTTPKILILRWIRVMLRASKGPPRYPVRLLLAGQHEDQQFRANDGASMTGVSDVAVAPVQNQRLARWFYIGMAAVVAALSVAGFGPSLMDPATRNVPLPLTPLVMAHTVLAAAWVFLFLVQATLIATRRTAVHRRLGIAGAALAFAFIVEGYAMAIEAARRGFDLTRTVNAQADPLGGLVLRLGLFLAFGLLVGAAVLCRHRADVHRRLMLLAMVGPLSVAPTTHLVRHWMPADAAGPTIGIITIALLSANAIYDRVSGRRVHPVSSWVALLLFAWQLALVGFLQTRPAVREFAAWLAG